MINYHDECLLETDDNFLSYIKDFLEEKDLKEKIKKLSRAEGYLRYIFFELMGYNIKDWRGGDLRTLVCGLSYLIVQSVKLCYETRDANQETACGISRDVLDIMFLLMKRWRYDEDLYRLGSKLWTELDYEDLGDEKEVENLSLEVSRSILSLLR